MNKTGLINTGLLTIFIGLVSSAFVWASAKNENDIKHFEADRRIEGRLDEKCAEIQRQMADYVANTREDVSDIKSAVSRNSDKLDNLYKILVEKNRRTNDL